jgi:hypothetical protein
MPGLFFSWMRSKEKRVHYEFLDNDVPQGELPRTAAFGWNDTLTILDPGTMLNIDRYRKVNVEATSPDEIFDQADTAAGHNVDFLKRCAEQIAEVNFATQSNGRIYAKVKEGRLAWCDRSFVAAQDPQSALRIALNALGYDEMVRGDETGAELIDIEHETQFTLGRWIGI